MMYLIDTDVVSEARKGSKADPGLTGFLEAARRENEALYLSVVTVAELRRAIEGVRRRDGAGPAGRLERWLEWLLGDYDDYILAMGPDVAQMWGALDLPPAATVPDRLVAATARIHGLTLVTRRDRLFGDSGVALFNPYSCRS